MKNRVLDNVKSILAQEHLNTERIKEIINKLHSLEKEAFECGLHSSALMLQATALYVGIEAFDDKED